MTQYKYSLLIFIPQVIILCLQFHGQFALNLRDHKIQDPALKELRIQYLLFILN